MNILGTILGEIESEIKDAASEVRNIFDGEDTVTLTVAKPYCMPARSIIRNALEPYHVKIFRISETTHRISLSDWGRRMEIENRTMENLKYGPAAVMWLPIAIVARVTVRRKAAAWAEYLMLRTGKLYVRGEYFEPRNAEWARKHGGKMPPKWDEGEPWIEKGCSDGMKPWQAVKGEVSKEQKRNSKPKIEDKLFGRRK